MAIVTLTANETGANSLIDINANFVDLDTTKADLASPTFTGTPTAPTQSMGDNSTKLATTAYADAVLGAKAKVRAYKSGGNQQIDTSYEKVLFESESYDTGSNFASSTFTAPRTGYYLITANGDGDSNSSSGPRVLTIAIYKDGVIYSSSSAPRTQNSGVGTGVNITDTLYLTANQTVEIYAVTNADSADFFSGEQYTFVTIIEL